MPLVYDETESAQRRRVTRSVAVECRPTTVFVGDFGEGLLYIRCVLALLVAAAPTQVAAQSSFAAQFPARILAAHNAERARAGVPPLTWDNALGVGRRGLCAADGDDRHLRPFRPHQARAASARICGWARAAHSASKRWSAAGLRNGASSSPASSPMSAGPATGSTSVIIRR